MPKVKLTDFVSQMQTRFPQLKQYDETRLFSALMQVGVNVEFDFDPDGSSVIKYDDFTPDTESKISQL